MGLTLIHIEPGRGPLGVWRIVNDIPAHRYTDPGDPAIERARVMLDAKGTNTPWDAWFQRLSERPPYVDDFETIEDSTTPLGTLLRDVVRVWGELSG
jgi:hypothetical protein